MTLSARNYLSATSAIALVLGLVVTPAQAQDEGAAATQLSLGKIVVSAGQEKVAIDTPQSVTVLDQEDIDNAQAGTIGDLLEGIAGVDAAGGVSSIGQGLNIRGMGTALSESDSRVVFTVDGVTKFFEGYRMGTLFTEPELYKRVEVLRGPSSSTVYGSGALAGVVNFTTKDASDFLKPGQNYGTRFKVGYDSNAEGKLGSLIFAARPLENLDVLIAANTRSGEDYKDGNGNVVSPSEASGNSVLVKTRYYIGGDKGHSLWASAQKWSSDSWQMYDQQAAAFQNMVRRKTEDTNVVFGYDNAFEGNDWLNLKAQLAFDESAVIQSDNTFSAGSLGLSSEYTYKTVQARVENVSEFSTGPLDHYLTVGLQVYDQQRRNPRYSASGSVTHGATTHPEGDMTRYSLYVQDEILIGEKLTIIPGLRFDKSKLKAGEGTYEVGNTGTAPDVDTEAFSPKIAAIYSINDHFNIFASVSHTERAPILDEIYTRGAGTKISINLDPEESENTEIGGSFTTRGLWVQGDRLNIKATVFRNDIKNLITRVGQADYTYSNVGEARYEGGEIEAEYAAQQFFARAAYSTVNGYNKETNVPFNTIPAEQINLTAGYVIPSWYLVVGWKGEFADHQNNYTATGANAGNVSSTTDSYGVHGLFATWRPQEGSLEGLELRVVVDNVADKYFKRHLSNLPAEGRTVRVSLGKSF
ncbi:MAG: TonB-dependent receptor [Asticcacaulis sp.]